MEVKWDQGLRSFSSNGLAKWLSDLRELGWDSSEPAILVHVIHKWYSFWSNLKTTIWVRKWACCAISPTTATKKTSSPYADHKHDPFLEIRSQSSTKMCLLHQLQERNEAVMMVVWNPVFTWPWIATVGYALGLSGYKYEQAVSRGSIWTISVVHPGTFQVQ